MNPNAANDEERFRAFLDEIIEMSEGSTPALVKDRILPRVRPEDRSRLVEHLRFAAESYAGSSLALEHINPETESQARIWDAVKDRDQAHALRRLADLIERDG